MTDPAILVMGVSGCGKSTLAAALARALDRRFVEADDLHPAANRARMAAGTPLTDADRWPWLDLVAEAAAAAPSVIACSALRAAYRERLSARLGPMPIVHLTGAADMLSARIGARRDHFMPASLLASQLATLEPPRGDAVLELSIDLPPETQRATALAFLDAFL